MLTITHSFDVDEFATREIDDFDIDIAARELREDLVLRALYHVKRQAQDHVNLHRLYIISASSYSSNFVGRSPCPRC